MVRYTQSSIDRVREAVDMRELVGARTDLRRVGSRWVGLCPFHDENTPSFSVDADQGLYHCFGCGAGGDAIRYVRETEQLDFAEAVELLAERGGVELELEHEDPGEKERRQRRDRLLLLLERATGFYEKYLWSAAEGHRARDYLLGRGLSEDVLRSFRVGYAPKAWDRLLTNAERDGFSREELTAAGLIQKTRSGGEVDRFRERIMFPLADARGRVLGFGARAMRDDQGAKYINTSENEIYHKGRQLFGIDRARSVAAKSGQIVVVEGYTDVLALHQSGVGEAVAIMGTALTEHQLSELARAAGSEGAVYLALDADRSGQQAMLRAAEIAADRDVELRVVQLPEGSDPADLIAAEGADAFAGRLQKSLSVLEFAVGRVIAEANLDSPESRDRALAQARDLIAAAPERSARRDHLVRLVADRLDVPADYVVATVPSRPARQAGSARPARPVHQARPDSRFMDDPGPPWDEDPYAGEPYNPEESAPPPPSGPSSAVLEAERMFLSLCLGAGPRGREFLGEVMSEHLSTPTMRRAREHLAEHFDDPLATLDPEDNELAELVAGIALRAEDGEAADEAKLRMSFLQLELRRLDREIKRASSESDYGRQSELAKARQHVRREMDAVMGQAT